MPTEDLRAETRQIMLRTLEDGARELFYRLSLVYGEFPQSLAMRIASIEPSIQYPGDTFGTLVGPWLSQLEDGSYEVTPLLREAGQDNLPGDQTKTVHLVCADFYLEDVVAAEKAINVALHLWVAEDYQRHVMFLTSLLMSVQTPLRARYFKWATWLHTTGQAWPESVSLTARMVLRAFQIKVRVLAEEDAGDLIEDLEEMMQQATHEDSMGVFFASFTVGAMSEALPPEDSLRWTLGAVQAARQNEDILNILQELLTTYNLEEPIWFGVIRIEQPEQLRYFLSVVRELSDEERKNLFTSELAVESSVHLVDKMWMKVADSPSEEQNWDELLSLFREVEDVGRLPGATSLRISAIRAQAIVLEDYLNQPEVALALLEGAEFPENSSNQFILDYSIANSLFRNGRYADAIERYLACDGNEEQIFSYYKLDVKKRLVIAYSKQEEFEKAKELWRGAYYYLGLSSEYIKYDRFEMLGELAYIRWMQQEHRRAFGALYGAVFGLIQAEDLSNPRYREVFNKLGHGVTWFGGQVFDTQVNLLTATGEEFKPVSPGFFGILNDKLADWEPPAGYSKGLLLITLAILADRVGLFRTAGQLHELGINLLEEKNQLLRGVSVFTLAALHAILGRPERAILAAIDAISCSIGSREIEEYVMLYQVLGPAFSQLLEIDLTEAEIQAQLDLWQSALFAHKEDLVGSQRWLEIVRFLRKLASIRNGNMLDEEDKEYAKRHMILSVLTYLALSTMPRQRLEESVSLQVKVVEVLLRSQGTHYVMLGTAKFLHRFWQNVVNTRSFALGSPQLFQHELKNINPRDGSVAAVAIMENACRSLNVLLPKEIMQLFREARNS